MRKYKTHSRPNRHSFTILLILAAAAFVFTGCGDSKSTPGKETKKIITVSILPQKYFIQRIAGDRFDVNVMIPPGHSPATYAPTPRQMQAVSHSTLYFRIGHVPFEKAWMKNIAENNPNMTVIDTSSGVDLITGGHHHHHHEGENQHGHDHGHADSHDHGKKNDDNGIDPHIWLSPKAVKIQVKHIAGALKKADPANTAVYEKNYAAFIADIDQLDNEIKSMTQPLAGKKFMVFHPAWSYFARDYHLEQLPIEIEGKTPSPAQMKEVIDTARQASVNVIFVQKQFDTHSAEAIAGEIGGRVVQLDPLAENWLENMKSIAQALVKELGKKEKTKLTTK